MADDYIVDRSRLFTSVYPKLNREFPSEVPPRKMPAGQRLSGMVAKIAYYDSSVLGGAGNMAYEETADPKKDGMLVIYWRLNIWPHVLGITPPSEANEKICRGLRVGHVVDDLFTTPCGEGGACFDEEASLLFVAPKGRDAWLAEDANLLAEDGAPPRPGHTSMRHLPQNFTSMGPEFALPPKKYSGRRSWDEIDSMYSGPTVLVVTMSFTRRGRGALRRSDALIERSNDRSDSTRIESVDAHVS